MISKIANLTIHDPRQSHHLGEILIENGNQNPDLNLVSIIEVDSKKPEDQNFIQKFLEVCHYSFEESQLLTSERALESVLNSLNQNIPAFLPRQKDWLKKLHCLVAIYGNGQLNFSAFGKIKIYSVKANLIKNIDLQEAESDTKLFNYTLNGEIKSEDRMLLTTESLINYISLDKIKKIVSTLPPQSAIAHLNNILLSGNGETSFFAVVIQGGKKPIEQKVTDQSWPGKLSVSTTSKKSIDQLISVEKETEKILTPPSWIEKFKNKFNQKPKASSDPRPRKEQRKSLQPGQLQNWLKNIPYYFHKSSQGLKKLFSAVAAPGQAFREIKQQPKKLLEKFNRLSKKNRIVLSIILGLALILSQSLIWQAKQKDNIKKETEYRTLLTEIDNKKNAIEASLIYNDTFRAKQLLAEIQDILNRLPANTKERQANNQTVKEGVQKLYSQVWKINIVAEPEIMAEFGQEASLSAMALDGSTLYAFDLHNRLFTVKTDSKEMQTFSENYPSIIKAKYNSRTQKIIGQTMDNKFYAFKNDNVETLTVNYPAKFKRIDDFTFYIDKMYILDHESQEVFRFTQSSNTFVAATEWLLDNINISEANSIAVDGFIYLLKQNGEIIRLSRGRNSSFATAALEPSFGGQGSIFTDPEFNNIYLLDPLQKRLVVLNKEGEYVSQFTSDKFNQLKDMIIDERNKKAYLLNGNQILSINL